jgi:photosystem II stability/assembly factor-like uncharacterized protein
MMKGRLFLAALMSVIVASVASTLGQGAGITSDTLKDFSLRNIGPMLTTGRVADTAVDPKDDAVIYVATAAGGLWKTVNHGYSFKPIFDHGGSFNLCCVVVDPKDSKVIWLGTGENSNPRASMYGDGLYKSTDAGETWTRVGLETSEHIGEIVIDPRDTNVVYVAVQGPLWSSGGDRGIFKTTDGGKTWKNVLNISPDTGGNGLAMDPNNPSVLYATTWQRRRSTGQFVGGGPESGVYKTVDGGAKWTKLTKGLPSGDMGRIAIALDGKVKPTRVYVLANARMSGVTPNESGFYRSDDGGLSFRRMEPDPQPASANAAPAGRQGGFGRGNTGPYAGGDPGYYHEIFVDPIRPDTIWSVNTNLERSDDGGKTWRAVNTFMNLSDPDVHVDFHDVWVDPKDKRHMIFSNDGGVYETYDEGAYFRHFNNLPVTQFYRVEVDQSYPFYRVCGGAQDNNSMCGPSRTAHRAGIRTSDWFIVGGGDGFQSRVDPVDPTIIYATSQEGGLTRLDTKTMQSRGIRPRMGGPGASDPDFLVDDDNDSRVDQAPGRDDADREQGGRGAGANRERVNWDAPYIISPHSHTRLYWGGSRVYRSDDRGDHWTPISPDLTRELDPAKIEIMGKLWDPAKTVSWNQATTQLSTIVSIDESPLLEGLLYVGTDDGLLQVTEDGGKNWRKVESFPGAPANTYVADVEPSPRNSDVVFVVLSDWQRGNYAPYIYRSDDRGRTFKSIVGDLPTKRNNLWSVEQDHVNPNLLFLGSEFALWTTVDGGQHWIQLKTGLPTAQIRDLAIQKRESDLALGTFGRGFYILDDYSALREITADSLKAEGQLYPTRETAFQFTPGSYEQAAWMNESTPNPPVGAMMTYSLAAAPTGGAKYVITFTDDSGKKVRTLDVDQTAGLHRVNWDLRGDSAAGNAGGRAGGGFGGRGGNFGPAVEPGRYTAQLGKQTGDTVTPVGQPQTFMVRELPPVVK